MLRYLLVFALMLIGLSKPAGAIEATAGHALFIRSADSASLEVFWEVNTLSLHYHKDSSGRLSDVIQTQLRISNASGIIYKDVYLLQTKPFNPDAEGAQRILEQQRITIPQGPLTIELYLTEDGHPEGNFYHKDTLTVLTSSGPRYSTLQLLDTFFISPVPSIFRRGAYQHIPRALNFYDEGQQNVNMYLELYHTNDLEQGMFPLIQTIYVSKRLGQRDIPELTILDTIKAGAPVVSFRRSISIATLSSGNYYINASLRNIQGVELATQSAFLQAINKHPASAQTPGLDTGAKSDAGKETYLDLGTTFVAKFSMPNLRAILKMMLPTADPADESAIRGFLNRPDEMYMRYFIYNHFAAINKADPGRAWKDFTDLIKEVNKLYNSGSTLGYETDRGIIYLKYGPPVEDVRVPNEAGALPYQIWRYNVGKKVGGSGLFLFYSPGFMSSDYRLLHSTVPGERQNPDWRSVLYSTGHSSGNVNARAEEYFGNNR